MKALYLFVLTAGVCLADQNTLPDPGHPGNSQVPIAPIVPTHNGGVHNDKGDKTEVVPSQIPKNATAEMSKMDSQHPTTASTPVTITTTSAPPKPIYGIGKWNVTDEKTGHVCIKLEGDLTLNLFNETNNQVNESFKVPSNAPSHGNCEEEWLELFLPNNSSLQLTFDKNITTSKFYLSAIKAKLNYVIENKTISNEFRNNTLHLFENPLDQSYYCRPDSENEIAHKPLQRLMLKVNNFQVQAYKNSTTKDFDDAVNCEIPHTPDIVPIIVGCALAVLVIMVLVAYLISRRRSQSRGYLSM